MRGNSAESRGGSAGREPAHMHGCECVHVCFLLGVLQGKKLTGPQNSTVLILAAKEDEDK